MNLNKKALVKRVLRENFSRYWARYLVSIMLMLLTAFSYSTVIYILKDVMNVVFGVQQPHVSGEATGVFSSAKVWLNGFFGQLLGILAEDNQRMRNITALALLIIFLFIIKGTSSYGAAVILNRIGNNIVARTQKKICAHLLQQSMRFFSKHPSSELMTLLTVGSGAINTVMSQMIGRLQDLFMAIGLITAMFLLDYKLSIFSLFLILPMVVGLSRIIKRVKDVMARQQLGFVQVAGSLLEGVLGAKVVKSYNLERHMNERYDKAITSVEQLSNRIVKLTERTGPLMESLGGIAIALVIIMSGYRSAVLNQDAGTLFGFIAAFLTAYEPVKRIARANVMINNALVGVSWVYATLDEDDRVPEPKNGEELKVTECKISLEDVKFSYIDGHPVLHGVSLECLAGKVTALVGPSGSGKSTVINLIGKLYVPDCGRVVIDGQCLMDVTGSSVRDAIAWVSQDTFLFDDTVLNNIRFGRIGATDEEIKEAARMAHAHNFISDLPNGYETRIGENGNQLSGGQKQRISIARAFLKNAKILLLDEATSALDSESEKHVQDALDTLMIGRTTIVIAHRFSTIRKAERICVFEGGRVVASGSHDELMSSENTLYSSLYRLQFESVNNSAQ